MTAVGVVPSRTGVRVTVRSALFHLCPHVDEIDTGTVEIGWTTTDGYTIELHSLAAHLRSYATQRISHEDLAASIYAALNLPDVTVTARFATAGLDVEVFGAAA